MVDYELRQKDPKRQAVIALHSLYYRVIAAGLEPHVDLWLGETLSTVAELVDKVNEDPRRGIGHEKVLTRIELDHGRRRNERPAPRPLEPRLPGVDQDHPRVLERPALTGFEHPGLALVPPLAELVAVLVAKRVIVVAELPQLVLQPCRQQPQQLRCVGGLQ